MERVCVCRLSQLCVSVYLCIMRRAVRVLEVPSALRQRKKWSTSSKKKYLFTQRCRNKTSKNLGYFTHTNITKMIILKLFFFFSTDEIFYLITNEKSFTL